MFCEKCGANLSDTANFCEKCGNSVVESGVKKLSEEKQTDTEVLLKVTPKFKLSYFLCLPLVNCVVILLIAVILGIVTKEIVISITILICFGGILIFSLISKVFKMVQIKNMKYDFYRTRVEYTDSFLVRVEKEVKYKNIRETVLIRSAIDRIWGYGTIIIYTSADGGRGITIPYVENSEKVYKEIKELLEK